MFFQASLCHLLLVFLATAWAKPTPSEPFPHHIQLDTNGIYHLFWKANKENITFEVHVKTKGYVGFGISPHGRMSPDSDVVIGWVKDGQAFFKDRNTKPHVIPIIDKSQDWHLLDARETSTETILKFWRNLDTCDREEDQVINDGTVRVIFSWHPDDPENETALYWHGGDRRGSKSVLLLSPPPKAPVFPPDTITHDFLNPNVTIPTRRTMYFCQAFKVPEVTKKHHIIRYEPILQPGNEGLVHHVLVYQCADVVPPNWHNHAAECYTPNMPDILARCKDVVMAWAVGAGECRFPTEGAYISHSSKLYINVQERYGYNGKCGTPFNFPDHVGFSLGTAMDPKVVVMETHYDNPELRTGVVDASGLRIHYTPTLRDNDAGVLDTGLAVNWHHAIPPHFPGLWNTGYCHKNCLKEAMDKSGRPQGVKIFSAFLHQHLIGTAVRVRHIRDGVELPIISEDLHYDFNFQETRILDKEIDVLPTDDLVVECRYNSAKRNKITRGGLESTEEMCIAFLYYYPRISLSRCTSETRYEGFPIYNTPFLDKIDWKNPATQLAVQTYFNNAKFTQTCEGPPFYSEHLKVYPKIEIKKPLLPVPDKCRPRH